MKLEMQEPAPWLAQTLAAIKWVLEFVRNLVVVGVLEYLAQKTGNSVLIVVAWVASMLLFIYLLAYIFGFVMPFVNRLSGRVSDQFIPAIIVAALIFIVSPLLQQGLRDTVHAIATAQVR